MKTQKDSHRQNQNKEISQNIKDPNDQIQDPVIQTGAWLRWVPDFRKRHALQNGGDYSGQEQHPYQRSGEIKLGPEHWYGEKPAIETEDGVFDKEYCHEV